MKIDVKVFPKSSREEIKTENGIIKVYVKVAPENDKANKAVIGLIAEKYGVKKYNVKIVKGGTSRNKVLEVIK